MKNKGKLALEKKGMSMNWNAKCPNCKEVYLYFHDKDKYFECTECKIRFKVEYPRFTCDTNRIVLKNPTKWIHMTEFMDNDTKKRILMSGAIGNINTIVKTGLFNDWEIGKVYEWFEKSKTILNDDTINNIQNILNEYENYLLNLDNVRFDAWK